MLRQKFPVQSLIPVFQYTEFRLCGFLFLQRLPDFLRIKQKTSLTAEKFQERFLQNSFLRYALQPFERKRSPLLLLLC